MSKILYLGPYKHGSGYSNAAVGDILAINHGGHDIYVHNTIMSNQEVSYPNEIKELEKKGKPQNPDIIIQRNIPPTWYKKGGARCIGAWAWETDYFPDGFIPGLELIDEFVVPERYNQVIHNRYFQDKKCHVVPHVVAPAEDLPPIDLPIPKGYYIFYSIAEWTARKGWEDLIATYLSTFTANDPVALFIKTNSSEVNDLIKKTIEHYRIKMPAKIVTITSWMSETDIKRLHVTGDCFVTASKGEGFCLPAYDARVYGNTCIVPENTCFQEADVGWLKVLSYPEPVYGDGWYTGWWETVDKWTLSNLMKQVAKLGYEKCTGDMSEYNIESVSQAWDEVING